MSSKEEGPGPRSNGNPEPRNEDDPLQRADNTPGESPEQWRSPLDWALKYADHGLPVFPCRFVPDEDNPLNGTKKPLTKNGFYDATTDPEKIRGMWNARPDALIGMPTGEASGILVIDLDVKKDADGHASLPEWQTMSHIIVSTPNGGHHLWFRQAPEVKLTTGVGILPGVDVRAKGGYVIMPGSVLPDGRRYEWHRGGLGNIPMLTTPPSLRTPPKSLGKGKKKSASAANGDGFIRDGERDDTLASIAGSLRARGFSEEQMYQALLKINDDKSKMEKPLPEKDIRKIARSIGKKPPGDFMIELTEVGNAKRLIQQAGGDLRYCQPWKKWLNWDGCRWREDDHNVAVKVTKRVLASIRDEATTLLKAGRQEAAAKVDKFFHVSQTRRMVENALWLARDEVAVRPDDLDANDWLLNVENGTLNLKTFQLREHRRSDLITKIAPVIFDPTARCPTWERFLDDIYAGKAELIAFLQRAVGYALTGSTQEQVFLLFHGEGQNGKSTLLETLLSLLGDYAGPTEFRTLLQSDKPDRIRDDLAALVGLRMVTAVEIAEGRLLDETVVKQITGGDTITARKLYTQLFTFRPNFKLFLAANHKPEIRGLDKAIWRRVLLVPHDVTIADDKVDPAMPEKLKAELPGILNWALEGCRRWQEEGLSPPDRIVAATAAYQEEQNWLRDFLDTWCIVDHSPDSYVISAELLALYGAWCRDNGEHELKALTFNKLLGKNGFDKKRLPIAGKKRTVRIGLRLREEAREEAQRLLLPFQDATLKNDGTPLKDEEIPF